MNVICRNCEFWNTSEKIDMPGLRGALGFGLCKCLKFVYAGDGNDNGLEIPDDGLAYWDYENYKAGLMTGGEFGCIHWQPKQEGE